MISLRNLFAPNFEEMSNSSHRKSFRMSNSRWLRKMWKAQWSNQNWSNLACAFKRSGKRDEPLPWCPMHPKKRLLGQIYPHSASLKKWGKKVQEVTTEGLLIPILTLCARLPPKWKSLQSMKWLRVKWRNSGLWRRMDLEIKTPSLVWLSHELMLVFLSSVQTTSKRLRRRTLRKNSTQTIITQSQTSLCLNTTSQQSKDHQMFQMERPTQVDGFSMMLT